MLPQHVFVSYARSDRGYVDELARYITDAGSATRPAPTVTVSKGTPCGDGTGATEECAGGFCTWEARAYIHVATAGFASGVEDAYVWPAGSA